MSKVLPFTKYALVEKKFDGGPYTSAKRDLQTKVDSK